MTSQPNRFAVATTETVYGAGATKSAAGRDAQRWLDEAEIAHDDDSLDVYAITSEQAEQIAAGNVSIASLGITRAQSCSVCEEA